MAKRIIYIPTKNDIRNACLKIQESWSTKERQKRAGKLESLPWIVPDANISGIEKEEIVENYFQNPYKDKYDY